MAPREGAGHLDPRCRPERAGALPFPRDRSRLPARAHPGPSECHAQPAMPVGRAPHARRAQPAGGPVAGGQARGLGAGSRGTSRPCPSPRQPWWDQLQWAHHTGSCYLGTVPKGRVAAVEETTREVALDSVPAAGHGAAGLGPCTPPGCPPHSCPDGGGVGEAGAFQAGCQARPQRHGPEASISTPSLQTVVGNGGHIVTRGCKSHS